jgi:flagellar protein FlaG
MNDMSLNIPIGGVDSHIKVERAPVVTKQTTDSVRSQFQVSQIHNSEELRTAERTGLNITVGDEQLIIAIERANKALQGINTSFRFSIHEGTKEIMVKVLDKDTGELVREIPSEKILDMVANLQELSGSFVDERM